MPYLSVHIQGGDKIFFISCFLNIPLHVSMFKLPEMLLTHVKDNNIESKKLFKKSFELQKFSSYVAKKT